jgi:hypothetical protein
VTTAPARRFGWKPDPPTQPGERPDLRAAELLAGLPIVDTWSNRSLVVELLDQGPAETCVAHSIPQAVRMQHVKQGIARPALCSRLFGYWVSRAYHHATGEDDGTYLRTFMQGLSHFGFCPESRWPYDLAQINRMPPWDAFRGSFDQHAPVPTIYSRIDTAGQSRIDDIKRAIAAGHGVCFGTLVSDRFCANDLGDGPLEPPVGLTIAGGHALVAAEYDKEGVAGPNSWGTSWGDEGWFHFSWDYMAWPETSDLWVINSAPVYSEGGY